VALFFLISGFVIPFSFRHHTPGSFLVARVLRIYPTYLAAVAVGLVARLLSSWYWGHPFEAEPFVIVSNCLLIQDLLGLPSIDLVNWTLAIELKFYLMFALCYPLIMRWREWFVLGVGVAAIGLNLIATAMMPDMSPRHWWLAVTVGDETMSVAYMMLGTLFFLNIQGLLSTGRLLGMSLAGLGLFVVCWAFGCMSYQFPSITENYLFGWACFTLSFFARHRFVSNVPLRCLAAISYPLYLVHPMVGYVVMAILMMGFGLGYVLAATIAFATAVMVASVVHLLVERQSISSGRAIALKVPSLGMAA
jgi:peptidoglycan/LPS O-acetylase OafA/YrhL